MPKSIVRLTQIAFNHLVPSLPSSNDPVPDRSEKESAKSERKIRHIIKIPRLKKVFIFLGPHTCY